MLRMQRYGLGYTEAQAAYPVDMRTDAAFSRSYCKAVGGEVSEERGLCCQVNDARKALICYPLKEDAAPMTFEPQEVPLPQAVSSWGATPRTTGYPSMIVPSASGISPLLAGGIALVVIIGIAAAVKR